MAEREPLVEKINVAEMQWEAPVEVEAMKP